MRCPPKRRGREQTKTTDIFIPMPQVTRDHGAIPSTASLILLSRSISRTVRMVILETSRRLNPAHRQIVIARFDYHVVHGMPSEEGADAAPVKGSASGPSVPLLYQRFREVRPLLKGFLFQLHHVSECTGPCSYPWCSPLKRDLHHASICTDMQCKLCSVLRLLLLLHSRCCNRPQCTLPFCLVRLVALPHPQHYRTAWSTFIMCMNGCPAPDFADVLGLRRRPAGAARDRRRLRAQERQLHADPHLPRRRRAAERRRLLPVNSPQKSVPHSPMEPSPKHQRSASVSQVLSGPQPLTPISAMLSPGLLNPGSLNTPASASTPLTSTSLQSGSLQSDPKEESVGLLGAAPNHRRDMVDRHALHHLLQVQEEARGAHVRPHLACDVALSTSRCCRTSSAR